MSIKRVLVVVAAACTASCVHAASEDLKSCPAVASEYFGKSPAKVVDAFAKSDLETKYRIYLCGNQKVHPPALYLAASFALDGGRAADFLGLKLAETRSDATVRDITRVYAEMQRQGTYDVKGDARLMKLLKDRSATIQDDYWRKYCADLIGEISYLY